MGPGAEQLPMTLESASFSSCDPKGYIDKVSMVFGLGDTSISLKKPRPQREIGVWRIVVLLARDGRLFGTKRLGASKLVCLAFIHGRDLVVVAPCHKMGVGLGLRLSESNARAAYTACLDTAHHCTPHGKQRAHTHTMPCSSSASKNLMTRSSGVCTRADMDFKS